MCTSCLAKKLETTYNTYIHYVWKSDFFPLKVNDVPQYSMICTSHLHLYISAHDESPPSWIFLCIFYWVFLVKRYNLKTCLIEITLFWKTSQITWEDKYFTLEIRNRFISQTESNFHSFIFFLSVFTFRLHKLMSFWTLDLWNWNNLSPTKT